MLMADYPAAMEAVASTQSKGSDRTLLAPSAGSAAVAVEDTRAANSRFHSLHWAGPAVVVRTIPHQQRIVVAAEAEAGGFLAALLVASVAEEGR